MHQNVALKGVSGMSTKWVICLLH